MELERLVIEKEEVETRNNQLSLQNDELRSENVTQSL